MKTIEDAVWKIMTYPIGHPSTVSPERQSSFIPVESFFPNTQISKRPDTTVCCFIHSNRYFYSIIQCDFCTNAYSCRSE